MKFEEACKQYLKEEELQEGWTGVDLDGTLAEYHGWKGAEHIGAPVISMLDRVKGWLKEGRRVKIFTARAADTKQIPIIQAWLKENGLPQLEITNIKDKFMSELWDDRVIQVEPNTGRPIAYSDEN